MLDIYSTAVYTAIMIDDYPHLDPIELNDLGGSDEPIEAKPF